MASNTPRPSSRPNGVRTRPAAAGRGGSASRRARRGNPLNYPRHGVTGAARWIPGWRVIALFFALLVAAGALLFALAWILIDVPEPGDFAVAQTTEVYYADTSTAMGQFSEFNRESVPLDTLPVYVGHAVVASEDRRFYENNGVDLVGTARALVNNLQGKPTQGGSTLTQQYVERYYMDTTTSYLGKFKEAILALKINLAQPKEEVLENYLNTIYFGRGAYGVETASQAYFGKPAAEMTLSESALLAGIIPAPSAWDPAKSPERAEQRWNRVLDLMVQDGWISQQQRDEATFPAVLDPSQDNMYAGPQGYLLDMIRTELNAKAGLTDEQIDRGGYRITSTINPAWQQAAVDSVASLPGNRPENNHVAMVSVDPTTGAIRMLYGGADYLTRSRNAVTQDRAQAGSTFKPFTMVAALEDGASLGRRYSSNSPMRVSGWDSPVRNFNNYSFGTIDMLGATANSVNTYYAQLNRDVGPQATVDAAVKLGVPADTPGLEPFPSNVLGPASPRPIDMARAFSTIAGGGTKHEPFIVAEVTDQDGNVVFTGGDVGEQVLDPQVAADATYAMRQVVTSGSAQRLSGLGRQIAGKTGTSSENRSAWFIGYIPQMVTVVAMYESDEAGNEVPLTNFGGVRGITGSTFPVNLWRNYMEVPMDDLPAETFPARSSGRRDQLERDEPLVTRTRAPQRTQAPAPRPTQAPAPQPTQEETTEAPAPEPTQEPAPTTEAPAPAPAPSEPVEPPATQPTEGTQPQQVAPGNPEPAPTGDGG